MLDTGKRDVKMLCKVNLHGGSILCAMLLLGLIGCTPTTVTPPGATASAAYNDQITAIVVGLDPPRRMITVQLPSGEAVQVDASDAVRNFDRIAVGDRVRLTVHSRIEVTAAGNQALPGIIVDEHGATAPLGAKPAAIWASRTQRSVQIVSVDKVTHTVTFREPDGSIDSIAVENPANFGLADGLMPGSFVTVVRTDAIAVSVDKI
jgi:hypothetical protein